MDFPFETEGYGCSMTGTGCGFTGKLVAGLKTGFWRIVGTGPTILEGMRLMPLSLMRRAGARDVRIVWASDRWSIGVDPKTSA